jgi:hypothetical protein
MALMSPDVTGARSTLTTSPAKMNPALRVILCRLSGEVCAEAACSENPTIRRTNPSVRCKRTVRMEPGRKLFVTNFMQNTSEGDLSANNFVDESAQCGKNVV